MTRRIFCKVLLVVVAIFGLLILSSVLSAQGNRDWAFERVREVQDRNTNWLMAIDGVEGTAIGYNQNERLAVKVFTAGPGVRGIPQELDGVPVQVVVTGKFYALSKPSKTPPGQAKKYPPEAPTVLTATPVSSSQIDLSWQDNADNEKGFKIERDSVLIDTVGANVTSYSDTGLDPLTTYNYRVCAYNGAGESDYSNEASAMTLAEGEEPPEDKPPLWCERPVPIGVSTGHPNITAGTIGCRVTDGTNVYALSNNHVYADENSASIDVDNVLQPGAYDGGTEGPNIDIIDGDEIGVLANFEPIVFSEDAENTIDAAIALSDTNLLGNATPSNDPDYPDGYGTPKSATFVATLGMAVQKYGRTTSLTKGTVTGINAIVNVGYSSGTARFVDQIVITGTRGLFSRGGDSGSLIVTQDGNNPVGLLFAGGGNLTIANPIQPVLDAFGVTVDGD